MKPGEKKFIDENAKRYNLCGRRNDHGRIR
jgi:hypothetical protein